MVTSILVAGFGGQGVMLTGQLLGHAATQAGLIASFFPAYGPEQRGGTANCTVVISNSTIASPVTDRFDILMILNEPSLNKYLPRLKSGGMLILNGSVISSSVDRTDIQIVSVPASDIASRAGSDKVTNIALLGAFVGATGILPTSCIEGTIREKLAKKQELLEKNLIAFQAGFQSADHSRTHP